MDILWYGLKVAVVGLVVVFVGLVILIGCIKALKALGIKKEAPAAGEPPAPPSASGQEAPAPVRAAAPALPTAREYVPGPPLTRKDDALYAVITGAIAQTLLAEGVNPEGGFRITSVRSIEELGPKLTQKDGALYAVITAAIARTLEAEGVNPEGGFKIASVTAV